MLSQRKLEQFINYHALKENERKKKGKRKKESQKERTKERKKRKKGKTNKGREEEKKREKEIKISENQNKRNSIVTGKQAKNSNQMKKMTLMMGMLPVYLYYILYLSLCYFEIVSL